MHPSLESLVKVVAVRAGLSCVEVHQFARCPQPSLWLSVSSAWTGPSLYSNEELHARCSEVVTVDMNSFKLVQLHLSSLKIYRLLTLLITVYLNDGRWNGLLQTRFCWAAVHGLADWFAYRSRWSALRQIWRIWAGLSVGFWSVA
jgi:hypothetical protein